MRPTVILTLISTPEQEARHYLEALLMNLEQYAARQNMEIMEVFRTIESATKSYRSAFERMI